MEVKPYPLYGELGGVVRGEVSVPEEARGAEFMTCRLRCYAKSEVHKEVAHDDVVRVVRRGDTFPASVPFAVPVPARKPTTFQGKVVTITWELEVVIHQNLFGNPSIEVPVHVGPRRLGELAD